jgi:hypothetical protein
MPQKNASKPLVVSCGFAVEVIVHVSAVGAGVIGAVGWTDVIQLVVARVESEVRSWKRLLLAEAETGQRGVNQLAQTLHRAALGRQLCGYRGNRCKVSVRRAGLLWVRDLPRNLSQVRRRLGAGAVIIPGQQGQVFVANL